MSYLINVLLKRLTWSLSYFITSNFNIVGWSWQRPYMHQYGMTAYVCAPSCFSSHFYYINSDLRRHFLICGYGMFTSLRCTISYPFTMSAYKLCISLYFSFVSTLWRQKCNFSFVYTLYPVLPPSVSTLYSIFSPPVSMLDTIYSWFDLVLTKFPTRSLIEGGPI